MFFEIHEESRIGYKCLTDADMGLGSSHQTHIGLFGDVLTFLPNHLDIEDALFIYDNMCIPMCLSFDRIENPDGTFRSPKIKVGGREVVSVVSKIREIVSQESFSTKWFLFWFGLKNNQPVFFLFNDQSKTYTDIRQMDILLDDKTKSRLTSDDVSYKFIMEYLENIVNTNSENILRELEVVSQTGEYVEQKRIKFRIYDINKAKANFEKTGKNGEILVNNYLEKLKEQGEIENYIWMNEVNESGLPYDFTIQELSGNIIYLDVKSTSFDFNQRMIFSSQELGFICDTPNEYHIYRVYNLNGSIQNLRICKNYKEYASLLWDKTYQFTRELKDFNAILQTAKISVNPEISTFYFEKEIAL